MKNKFLCCLALLAITIGCSDEFTEIQPVGALTDQALQNEVGLDLLLTGAYNSLGGGGFDAPGDLWWVEAVSDNAHKGSTDGDQANLFDIEMMTWDTANNYFANMWRVLYAGANRANAVIALAATIEDADVSGQVAEARFLRGYYYSVLQHMYGNPAYISEENYAASEFNQANSGPIWTQIEADFQFAIENLPATQPVPGKPTSWTAKAFMGKSLLYQSKWGEALAMFNDVINNGPYDLLPEFADNFRLAGDNSVESIFAIQFAADDANSPLGNAAGTLNFGGPFNCCGFYQPSQDLVNTFKTDANGLPELDTYSETDVTSDAGIPSEDPFTPYAGRLDPRLDYTVGRRGLEYNGWGIMPGKDWIRANFTDISGPYLPKKNIYTAGEDLNQGTGGWGQQHSGINFHIIRFSDVLLMAAEAAVETGDTGLALTYVNRVRNRAKDMTYLQNEAGDADAANYLIEPYPAFADVDFARKAVRFERRLELGMEAQRLFDLRRWGIAKATMDAYFVNEARTIPSIATKANPYQDRFDLMPIPLGAIDLSGNILQQNTGY